MVSVFGWGWGLDRRCFENQIVIVVTRTHAPAVSYLCSKDSEMLNGKYALEFPSEHSVN